MSRVLPRRLADLGVADDPCFFIVGPPRAGTTMLRLMLNRHPEVCVPAETWFFTTLMWRAAAYGDLSTAVQVERFAEHAAAAPAEGGLPVSEVFELPPEAIATALRETGARGYAQAFAAMMSTLARREGKRFWGEKTPFYTAYLPLLGRCYPRGRFLALVRDPRDVVVSLHRTAWGKRAYPTLVDAAMRWRYAVEGIDRARPVLGRERLFSLRYEDLVEEPEARLRELCGFLGLGFDPEMLSFHEDAEQRVPQGTEIWHRSLRRPISRSRVGRFRETLSPEEVGLIERACGPALERWGYRPEGRPRLVEHVSRIAVWKLKRWGWRLGGRPHWTRLLRPRR